MSSLQKRKRYSNNRDEDNAFENAAYCSTPKKHMNRKVPVPSKIICANEGTLTTKRSETIKTPKKIVANPYEVVRKPSKQISKQNFEDTCFENPALNLDGPERRLNPFEVLRDQSFKKENSQGFVNEGLNIKIIEDNLNPFEFRREQVFRNVKGFGNPSIDKRQPSNYKIALPFAPNMACRVDFRNISLSQLTPSKTISEKLVFSPVVTTGKRSQWTVSEESSVSISKELDRYQLELENSINEAKQGQNYALKQSYPTNIFAKSSECYQKLSSVEKLDKIKEIEETQELVIDTQISNVTRGKNEPTPLSAVSPCGDESYDEDLLETPIAFKRFYRPAQNANQYVERKTSKKGKKSILLGNAVRRSLRKLSEHHNKPINDPKARMDVQFSENPKTSFLNTIRRSLRLKNVTQSCKKSAPPTLNSSFENSIIYMEKTRIKFKSNILEATETEKGKKRPINIVRESTKDLVNSVLRLKQNQYDFN